MPHPIADNDSSRDRNRAANRRPPVESADAFPENELPKWLLRRLRFHARRALLAIRPPPYKLLARFSYELGTCARSSADMVRSMELCLKPLRGTRIGEHWSGAAEQIRRGQSLHAALRPAEDLLPPFYLPVIEAGEKSGRLDEALYFLERHCNLLAGPAAALRNVWLFPVAIMLFGSLIRFFLFLVMGSAGQAFDFLVAELFSWGQLIFIIAVAMLTPVRYLVDQLRLSLPLIGPLEREIALHRFFRVLSLVYVVGGHRVEVMIQTAAKTVTNHAARIELCKAATAIEQQATISDAFRRVNILSEDEKTSIEVGEMSGSLEVVFDQISEDTGESMVVKLQLIEKFTVRIVMYVVMMSIIWTMFALLGQWMTS